jgi:O-antigen ligase
VLAVSSRRSLTTTAAGVWAGAGVVAVYALGTRLYPVRFGITDVARTTSYRLADPFPYWNMLAALAAIGILLAVGLAARSRPLLLRVAAAMSLVPLALVLYFTYSRGAAGALAGAVVLVLLVDARRTQLATHLLMLAPAPAVAVVVASRLEGMTNPKASLNLAAHDGRFLAIVAVVAALGAALGVLVIAGVEMRTTFETRLVRTWGIVLLVFAIGGAVAATFPVGGPVKAARKAYDSYRGSAVVTGTNLNDRLFSLSANGRRELWATAREMISSAPLLGRGAGTYEGYWMAHRPMPLDTENAHSLYLQVLAETGVVGLVLLVLALLAPIIAVFRARRQPLATAAFGAYAVVLLQSIVDTDWQMPAVMIAALACGAAVVAAARREGDESDGARWPSRIAVMVLAVCLGVAAGYGLYVNRLVERAGSQVESGNVCAGLRDARQATLLAPWSAAAWSERAAVETYAGHAGAAAAAWRRAIGESPTDYRLWLGLSRVVTGADRVGAVAGVYARNPKIGAGNIPAPGPDPTVAVVVCR